MTIRLADVVDPRQLIGYRKNGQPIYLARGGDGTDDPGGDPNEDPEGDPEEDSEEDPEEDPKDDPKDTELQKAIRRRDRALREKRAMQRELEELRNKDKKKDEPDPVSVANARLVRSEVRAQLAAAGVTEREDQKEILEVLNLDGVSVSEDGDVDIDEIEDRIASLRRIFGGNGKVVKRTPRVDTRDRSSKNDKTTDPDEERYKRILGRR